MPEPGEDPVVEEIRQTRSDLFAESGNDMDRFFEDMRAREAAHRADGVSLVSRQPRTGDDRHGGEDSPREGAA
jgi:hypothetical protein